MGWSEVCDDRQCHNTTTRRSAVLKVFISGVDDMLGGNLALALAECCEVIGLYRPDRPVSLPGCTTLACELHNARELARCHDDHQPAWMIHCSELSRSSWDLLDCEPMDEPSVLAASENVAALAATSRCRVTVLSTDAVFTGPRLFHDEASNGWATTPVADLARRVESIFERGPALVVRTHAYGWGTSTTCAGLAERLWHQCEEDDSLGADAESHATPILATDLVPLLCRAYERELQGVYHMTGAERTSPRRFAQEMAVLRDESLEPEAALAVEGASEERALRHETSLNTRCARRELKLAMPLLREGMYRWIEQSAADIGHACTPPCPVGGRSSGQPGSCRQGEQFVQAWIGQAVDPQGGARKVVAQAVPTRNGHGHGARCDGSTTAVLAIFQDQHAVWFDLQAGRGALINLGVGLALHDIFGREDKIKARF